MNRQFRFAVDENFDNRILTGLRRLFVKFEAVSVREVGLSGADDPAVLEWSAKEERILLTHEYLAR